MVKELKTLVCEICGGPFEANIMEYDWMDPYKDHTHYELEGQEFHCHNKCVSKRFVELIIGRKI